MAQQTETKRQTYKDSIAASAERNLQSEAKGRLAADKLRRAVLAIAARVYVADTCAGVHLAKLRPGIATEQCDPVPFMAADGLIESSLVTNMLLKCLPGSRQALVLSNTPDALSIGCLVEQEKCGFSWFWPDAPRLFLPGHESFHSASSQRQSASNP